jgi:hypothetical protein
MRLENGNIVDAKGKVTFVSITAFVSDVCSSNICFLCTKALNSQNQNKEHIIPNWILKRFDLHNETVNLPNGSKYKYNQYVIPCCIECNSLLSAELETPLSKVFSRDFDGVVNYVENGGYLKVYLWMALLFIKTHVKDQSLRMHLDRRVEYSSIAQGVGYEWESFHHIYCLSRVPYTQATLEQNCVGSFFIVPVESIDAKKEFDYMDVSYASTSGVIIGNIGIITVFGDAGAVCNQLQPTVINKLSGSVTNMQFRELVARFACCSLHLKNNPKHSTISDSSGAQAPRMICALLNSKPEFESYNDLVFGSLMDMLLGELLEGKVAVPDFREKLKAGQLSILFDSLGQVVSPNKL